MVLKRVKRTYSDVYLPQLMWKHANISKAVSSTVSTWYYKLGELIQKPFFQNHLATFTVSLFSLETWALILSQCLKWKVKVNLDWCFHKEFSLWLTAQWLIKSSICSLKSQRASKGWTQQSSGLRGTSLVADRDWQWPARHMKRWNLPFMRRASPGSAFWLLWMTHERF